MLTLAVESLKESEAGMLLSSKEVVTPVRGDIIIEEVQAGTI